MLEEDFPGVFDGFEDILLSRAKCVSNEEYEKWTKLIPFFKSSVIHRRTQSYAGNPVMLRLMDRTNLLYLIPVLFLIIASVLLFRRKGRR